MRRKKVQEDTKYVRVVGSSNSRVQDQRNSAIHGLIIVQQNKKTQFKSARFVITSDAGICRSHAGGRGKGWDGGYERRAEFFTSSRCDCREEISRVPVHVFVFGTCRARCHSVVNRIVVTSIRVFPQTARYIKGGVGRE